MWEGGVCVCVMVWVGPILRETWDFSLKLGPEQQQQQQTSSSNNNKYESVCVCVDSMEDEWVMKVGNVWPALFHQVRLVEPP